MQSGAPLEEQSYDLYFRAGPDRFYFHNDNHGVTLTVERINWRFDGQDDGAPFTNIRSVQLHTGGDFRNPVTMCTVTFADRYKLVVLNSDGYGSSPDPERHELYRTFVCDLHGRLAASGAPIKFMAGVQGLRYPMLIACAFLIGLVCVVLPIGIMIIRATIEPVWALLAGVGLYWPMAKLIEKNAPRSYDPRALPHELLE